MEIVSLDHSVEIQLASSNEKTEAIPRILINFKSKEEENLEISFTPSELTETIDKFQKLSEKLQRKIFDY